jgi:hypothetical protein
MVNQSSPAVPAVSCHVPSASPSGWIGQAARRNGHLSTTPSSLSSPESGQLRIRVQLFAEWLRANNVGNVP